MVLHQWPAMHGGRGAEGRRFGGGGGGEAGGVQRFSAEKKGLAPEKEGFGAIAAERRKREMV